MKPATTWSYHPYAPPFWDAGDPYICRIAPQTDAIHLEWLGCAQETYRVVWKKRSAEVPYQEQTVQGCSYTITGLTDQTDYEFAVYHGKSRSRIRLARTGESVGTVVNYLHPEDPAYSYSGRYLCSPSILRHPDGHLLASMDLYAGNAPQNLTLIFRSDDDGVTWHYACELYPCFWGRMFVQNGILYMISCSTEYGDLLIGKSTDGGFTFSAPTVLLRGACKCDMDGIHKNPQPPVVYEGRIWETLEWGTWSKGYHAAMVGSAPADADLTNASCWAFSEPVMYDPDWPGTAEGDSAGNIEGTLAVLPDGNLYNIMRYDMSRCQPNYGTVLAYRVNAGDPEAPLIYDRAICLPGNHSKFMIRQDIQTGMYYTIISRIRNADCAHDRNLLSLMRSSDCEHWDLVCDLIDKRDEDPHLIGFQYVDFFLEGDDLLWLCRTAMNGAHNFHDANYSTFHRLKNFRSL